MVSLAEADGAIACWNDKYYWNFWRPIDAIHEPASDDNPTGADPNWKPLFDLVSPRFPTQPRQALAAVTVTLPRLRGRSLRA